MIQQVQIIDPEVWAEKILHQRANAYLMHIKKVENKPFSDTCLKSFLNEPLSDMPPKPILLFKYIDFIDVFSEDSVIIFSNHGSHDHAIDLVNKSKPLFYGPIYNLFKTELATLRAYIDQYPVTGFIRHSKSPARALIFFSKKSDGSLHLCIDYQGLNNITNQNQYPLLFVDKSLD